MEGPKPPNPLFTAAAWASLAVPVLGAAAFLLSSGGPAEPHARGQDAPKFLALAALYATSLVAGCVSLAGVRRNGAWVILPPAILGIVASLGMTLLALLVAGLSNLPGP
jgi:hypothetical protein